MEEIKVNQPSWHFQSLTKSLLAYPILEVCIRFILRCWVVCKILTLVSVEKVSLYCHNNTAPIPSVSVLPHGAGTRVETSPKPPANITAAEGPCVHC